MNLKKLLQNKTALIIIAIILIIIIVLFIRHRNKKKAEAAASENGSNGQVSEKVPASSGEVRTTSPCQADIAEAKEKGANMGACPKSQKMMTCPHDSSVTYAADGCQEKVLADKGWT